MKIQNPRPEVGMTAPIPGHWAQIHAQYKNKAILLNAPNRSRQSSFRNCGNSSMPKCGLKARWRAGKNTSKPRPAAICQAFPGLCRTLRSAKAGVWIVATKSAWAVISPSAHGFAPVKTRASPKQPVAKTEFQKNMQDRRLMATALMQHRKQEKENGKHNAGKGNSCHYS